jgi:hypothetical protein
LTFSPPEQPIAPFAGKLDLAGKASWGWLKAANGAKSLKTAQNAFITAIKPFSDPFLNNLKRPVYAQKNWAAVRREERRELPQPVVIKVCYGLKCIRFASQMIISKIILIYLAE